jgi:5-methyltetrahydrofolate--homocysteine methyltransferase
MALVNAEKLERYASLGEADRKLAEDLLYNRGPDPVTPFAAQFREARAARPKVAELPLDERLARYVVEGTRDGLLPDLDSALASLTPLEVINGPLMRGMDEVGRLFGAPPPPYGARCCWPPSRGTCTTLGRTWSKLFSPTTASKW